MLRIVSIFTLCMLSGAVVAQEKEAAITWSINTTLRTGPSEQITCTMSFPNIEGKPKLRMIMQGQAGYSVSVRFEARGLENPASDIGSEIPVKISIGSSFQGEAPAEWRASNEGTLTYILEDNISSLLASIARASTLTLDIGGVGTDYSLAGSFKAITEYRKCLGA